MVTYMRLLERKAYVLKDFFKPEEWTDNEGVKHNHIVMVATKLYIPEVKEEETPVEPAKKTTRRARSNPTHSQTKRPSGRFSFWIISAAPG